MVARKNRPPAPVPNVPDDARVVRESARSWRRGVLRTLIVFAILGGSVWLTYRRAIHAPMIFDDGNSIVHNPSIKRLWPLFGTAEAPGPLMPEKDFCTSGRPLPNLSLALNYYFGQRDDPTGYHIFNTWFHIANAMLLWAIVRRTLRLEFFAGRFESVAEPLALIVALLWAVHPLNVDAVQYITQRTELMMGFCYLGTLLASMHYWSATSASGRGLWVVLAGVACVAGAACKEVMVSAPAMILLFERTFIAGSFRRAVRNSWPLYAGLLCGWGMILLLNVGGPALGISRVRRRHSRVCVVVYRSQGVDLLPGTSPLALAAGNPLRVPAFGNGCRRLAVAFGGRPIGSAHGRAGLAAHGRRLRSDVGRSHPFADARRAGHYRGRGRTTHVPATGRARGIGGRGRVCASSATTYSARLLITRRASGSSRGCYDWRRGRGLDPNLRRARRKAFGDVRGSAGDLARRAGASAR